MKVDTIDERLALFREMAEHAGVDIAALTAHAPQDLRAAAQRCLGCRDAPECHRWFETRDEATPVPGFCRNAPQFEQWTLGEGDPQGSSAGRPAPDDALPTGPAA